MLPFIVQTGDVYSKKKKQNNKIKTKNQKIKNKKEEKGII
jgi:hypothetical protein